MKVKLTDLHPTQLYLSEKKLQAIQMLDQSAEIINMDPILSLIHIQMCIRDSFYDDQGHLLRPVGASIGRVDRIDTSAVPNALQDIELLVLTDVTNPLCGSQGATYIYEMCIRDSHIFW